MRRRLTFSQTRSAIHALSYTGGEKYEHGHCRTEEERSEAESARAAEEVHHRCRGHGRFRIDQGLQAAGRDNESEFDLCRDSKRQLRAFARRGNCRSQELWTKRRGA